MNKKRTTFRTLLCGYGGTGRREGFRILWKPRAGSIPVIRTKQE